MKQKWHIPLFYLTHLVLDYSMRSELIVVLNFRISHKNFVRVMLWPCFVLQLFCYWLDGWVIWILSWMVVLRSCFVLQLFCYCLDGWVIWMLSWMVVLSPCVVLNYFAIVLTDESYEFWLGDAMTLSPVLGLFCCYLDFHKHSFLYRERPNLLLQQTLSYWILRSADETRNYLEN